MIIGNLNHRLLRTGLSVVAALLVSTAVHAQDVVIDEDPVMYAVDPIYEGDDGTATGEPDGFDGGPIYIIDDGDFIPDDPGEGDTGDDTGDDTGGDDEWVDDDWVDAGDESGDGDGMVWAGGDPDFCEACGGEVLDGVPVEIYQMSAGGIVADEPAAVAAKPRRSSAQAALTNRGADCLELHPQLPWLCEWQTGAGH